MKKKMLLSAIIVGVCLLIAWTPLLIINDPLVRMPGTQPNQGVNLEGPNRCLNCHAGYDQQVEPGFNWVGSMMAQAARDPIFYACMTVALQDAIWAVGNANAGDLCERCHYPGGWLGGRSEPANASSMTGIDFDGIHCDFCHNMYDPFFETTYAGTRESNDWQGYWDEATASSQTSATTTYQEDKTLAAQIKTFSGDNFYNKFNVPLYSTYTESTSGQFYVSTGSQKRAGFSDANAKHQMLYSRFHKSKYMCATCHDVSNPVLANLGLSPLPDQSGGIHKISEQYSAHRYFHVERTFSEFMLSDYGSTPGAATNIEFQQNTGGLDWAGKCQDCHMRDGTGYGCNKAGVPLRPDGSAEHPNSGMPIHDMTGGNVWISYILASLDPAMAIYDPVNVSILNKGPAVLTLDLAAGENPTINGPKLKAGSDRAKDQLNVAATIKNLQYNPMTGDLGFRVQNNTGHKLISGFPEGRRMFVNIKAYFHGNLIYQANPYDYTVGTLKGLPHSNSSPALGTNEEYIDELVYEVHPKSDLTGENETFHFVLATGRYKDNRIPPKGFDIASAPQRICEPVWHGQIDPNYFTAEEYAGGYDDISIKIPHGADSVSLSLFYQGTSREYIEFLRDEINGTNNTLSSPTLSGEANAYIAQTDPFFAKLKAWGNTIWDLWYHNHGLDGSGKAIAGILPYNMAQASISVSAVIPGDFEPDGDVDIDDLAVFSGQWLTAGPAADIAPLNNPDGIVDMQDFALFAVHWLSIH